MAFIKNDFQKITSSLNDAQPRGWSYSSTTDTLAQVQVAGYFNNIIDETSINDLVYINASDGAQLFKLGPLVGNDLTLTIPTQSYINLQREFTTTATVPEDFTFIVPLSGNIISASIAPPNGTGAGEAFSFDLVSPTATVLTLNVAQLTPAGFTGSTTPLADPHVNQDDALKWTKGAGVTAGIVIQGAVILEID